MGSAIVVLVVLALLWFAWRITRNVEPIGPDVSRTPYSQG